MTRYGALASVIASTALFAASSAQAQTASDLIAQIARELDRGSVRVAHSNGAETAQEIRVLGETVTSTINIGGSINVLETVEFNLSNIGSAVWGLDADGFSYELRVFCRQSTECISISSPTQNRKVNDWYVFYHTYGQTPAGYHPITHHSENIDEERVASLINQLAAVGSQPAPRQPISAPQDAARSTAASIERSLGLSNRQRAAVQEALNSQGHDSGSADGIFGPRTRAAIKAFQRALGLEPTGFLNDDLLERLAGGQSGTGLAGTVPSTSSCVAVRRVGTDSSDDNYSVEVEFANNCAHKISVRWRHLIGLKYEYERGSPIRCSSGSAMSLDPGDTDIARMGPLPRGITQKWRWCSQYWDEDIQEQTGFLNCYESNQPTCPPIP